MKPYNGFEPKISGNARQKLPPGGYVARIMNAYIDTKYGEMLVIEFDIAEGEYTSFYQADYESQANSQYGQKWKGIYSAYVPDEKNAKFYDTNRNIMNNIIGSIQASNPGYKWNWDERTLKGLIVGVLMREKEFKKKDGNGTAWVTECFKMTDANIIRSGKFEVPAPKSLNNSNTNNSWNVQQYGTASFDMPPLPMDSDAPPVNTYNYRGVQDNVNQNGNATVQTNTQDGFNNGWMGSDTKLPWET